MQSHELLSCAAPSPWPESAPVRVCQEFSMLWPMKIHCPAHLSVIAAGMIAFVDCMLVLEMCIASAGALADREFLTLKMVCAPMHLAIKQASCLCLFVSGGVGLPGGGCMACLQRPVQICIWQCVGVCVCVMGRGAGDY